MSFLGEGLYEWSAQDQSLGAPMHRYCIKFPLRGSGRGRVSS